MILIIIYISVGLILVLLQEKFMFHPKKLDKDFQYSFDQPFSEMNIPFSNGDNMHLVKFHPATSQLKGLVLYFHGNMENIGHYSAFANDFTHAGYEVWMMDYPGFGKSTGKISEQKLYDWAMKKYDLAVKDFNPGEIVIFGKSLGTGIAAYVAAKKECKALLLETPYYSMPSLFACWAPVYPHGWASRYKLPVNEYLQQVSQPITIFQGTNDWVVPYRCSRKLKAVLKETDEFITIPGGNHHNLGEFEIFHLTIRKWL